MRTAVCLIAILLATGCGAPRAAIHTDTAPPAAPASPPPESLAAYIGKVRVLAAEAAAQRSAAPDATLEARDPALAQAVAAAGAQRTPAAYRAAADAYRRHGIFDAAHRHLVAALAADHEDARTYEALARLWRDSRVPHLALGDAHRATYYAPDWPVAHNTLGTVFQALGRHALAREAYARALELNPSAAYALNNLCYGWLLDGRLDRALDACDRALRLAPDLRAARNNLALVQAAAGNVAAARRTFAAANEPADALYNIGMTHLARREFTSAVKAFEAAHALNPAFERAAARAAQAVAHLARRNER